MWQNFEWKSGYGLEIEIDPKEDNEANENKRNMIDE